MQNQNVAADKLRKLINSGKFLPMPCCFDALSAKLTEQADFQLTFMSGFATSASRLGAPDLGLMSYAEVVDQARNINEAISIPMIAAFLMRIVARVPLGENTTLSEDALVVETF